jgi:hypothetical protein
VGFLPEASTKPSSSWIFFCVFFAVGGDGFIRGRGLFSSGFGGAFVGADEAPPPVQVFALQGVPPG